MKTTLNAIRSNDPCEQDWEKLLKYLGKTKADDEPLLIRTILESNGLYDAFFAMRVVDGCDREIRLFAVWCARQVQHLMTDARSLAALDMAERFANGETTADELRFARFEASRATGSAARAAGVSAVVSATMNDTSEAAWSAFQSALNSIDATRTFAMSAAMATGVSDSTAALTAELIRVCLCIEKGEDPYPRGEK